MKPATRPSLADYLILIEELRKTRDAVDQDIADLEAEATAKWGGLMNWKRRPPTVRGTPWGRG